MSSHSESESLSSLDVSLLKTYFEELLEEHSKIQVVLEKILVQLSAVNSGVQTLVEMAKESEEQED